MIQVIYIPLLSDDDSFLTYITAFCTKCSKHNRLKFPALLGIDFKLRVCHIQTKLSESLYFCDGIAIEWVLNLIQIKIRVCLVIKRALKSVLRTLNIKLANSCSHWTRVLELSSEWMDPGEREAKLHCDQPELFCYLLLMAI